jgi:hypothetical protein
VFGCSKLQLDFVILLGWTEGRGEQTAGVEGLQRGEQILGVEGLQRE